MRVVILIPARLASTRLPGKPMADIGGRPMIVRVADRAAAAGLGRVVVATDSPEIRDAVVGAGHEAAMTRADHASGSDRIFEALQAIGPAEEADIVVNLQGDLPTIEPEIVGHVLAPLADPACDIATLAVAMSDERERTDPNIVKLVGSSLSPRRLRALYFTRATAPWGEGPLYHHVGIYAYRRAALSRFVRLPPSPLELRERLEQLRALEAGMRIDAELVDTVPFGVDTPRDLEKARAFFAGKHVR